MCCSMIYSEFFFKGNPGLTPNFSKSKNKDTIKLISVHDSMIILLSFGTLQGRQQVGDRGDKSPPLLKVGGHHIICPPPTFFDQTHYWKHEKLLCFNNIIHLAWFLLHSALKCLFSMANIQKVPTMFGNGWLHRNQFCKNVSNLRLHNSQPMNFPAHPPPPS